jgi:hypothetical protein
MLWNDESLCGKNEVPASIHPYQRLGFLGKATILDFLA